MFTGLLDDLHNKQEFNVRKWVEETLSRHFGMCFNLREYSKDLTKEQMIELLEEEEKTFKPFIPSEPKFITREEAYKNYLSSQKYFKETIELLEDLDKKYNEVVIPELNQLYKYADVNKCETLMAVIKYAYQQIDIAKEEIERLDYYREQANKEFEYNEEEARKQYEEDLKRWKEDVAKRSELPDISSGYKFFLAEVEQAYNSIGKENDK